MKSWVFRVLLVVLAVFSSIQLGAVHGDNHISWEDMIIDGRYDLGNGTNDNRVIVVAKDGTGNSSTVQGAVDLVPNHNTQRMKIFILPGIYRERVTVPKTKPFISFIGIENTETVITWNAKASDKDDRGREIGTFHTATVDIQSDYFCATGITIENSIVPRRGGVGMQAVSLKVTGDKSMFFRVRIVGSQDTLLDLVGRHYFYQSYIEGTVDFICGNGRSIYKECVLHSTATRSGAIAAHHRNSADEPTGFSFIDCSVNGTGRIYLGRAWGNFARTVYSHCHFDDIINPVGWNDMGHPSSRENAVFGEYRCDGRGSNTKHRAQWAKPFGDEDAKPFMDMKFIDADQWLKL